MIVATLANAAAVPAFILAALAVADQRYRGRHVRRWWRR
jgi:hypothetical protein